MKFIIASFLFCAATVAVLAEEPQQRLVQVDETKLVEQALAYLTKSRPGVDPKQLEFYSVEYSLTQERDGYFEGKADGKGVFVKSSDVQERTMVTFKLVASEEKTIKDGRYCAGYKTLVVNFPRPGVPSHINDGALTVYGDYAKE